MFVQGVRVEHEEEGLFRKVGHLLFYWLRIPNCVTLRKIELGQWQLLHRVIEEGDILLSERPITCQCMDTKTNFAFYSHVACQIKSKVCRIHAMCQSIIRRVFYHQSQESLDAPFIRV